MIARRGLRAPTTAGTFRDVAVLCATVALALYVYGVMCYLRSGTASYTCMLERYGASGISGTPPLESNHDSLIPVSSTCTWSDGYTLDFLPFFVTPVAAVLLVIAVCSVGLALGYAGAVRDLSRRS
ncbi:hypothetical protein ACWGI8_06500 [Streptomyces sp. NPDC054841]